MSGLIATNWYVVTPGSTVAAESMWPGQWQAGSTYLHNNITLGGNTSIVVGQNGGGGGSGGYTARYLPTPMAPGTELTAIAFMWFTAPQGSPNEWTEPAFGFASSGAASAARRLPTSSSDTTMRRLRCRSRKLTSRCN